DGRWVLHQQPRADNAPLYWYSHRLPRFIHYEVGGYECLGPSSGRRPVQHQPFRGETWLSDRSTDPNELSNLVGDEPEHLERMQSALRALLAELGAPSEQIDRLGLDQPRASTMQA